MDKIFNYNPEKNCELVHNSLVSYFQNMDDELSTEEMVLSFIKWMNSLGLTLTGKKIIVECSDKVPIDDINALQKLFENNPLEPLTIVVPSYVSIKFDPACEHLNDWPTSRNFM